MDCNAITIIPEGCLEEKIITLHCKSPEETLTYGFTIVSRMMSTDYITDVSGQPSKDSGVIIHDVVKGAQTFSCKITGGRLNHDVGIRFIIYTNEKNILEFTVKLPIRSNGILYNNGVFSTVLDATSPAGTISIGEVVTIPPDQPASVTNVGTSTAALLNFKLPQGPHGTAATVKIGNVTTGESGSEAVVVNSGDTSNAILDFILPTGKSGEVQIVRVGETKTLPAGHDATVEATTVNNVVTLNFGIPSGTTGEAGQYILNVGDIKTVAPDEQATASITSDGKGNHFLNLSIPQGAKGDTGPAGNSVNTISVSSKEIVFTMSDGTKIITVPEGIYVQDCVVTVPEKVGILPDDLILNGNIYTAPDVYLNGSKKLPAGLSLNSNIVITDGSVFFPKTINNNGVLCAA